MGTPADREAIYRTRHQVYAEELGQHAPNPEGLLFDALDRSNIYLVAEDGTKIAGFVSITPPTAGQYSVDKYLPRQETGLAFDDGLFEVRLLTVLPMYRRALLAHDLMVAALQAVRSRGGTTIMALGRDEILAMYEAAGLVRQGPVIRSGKVEYHLLRGVVTELEIRAAAFQAARTRHVAVPRGATSVAPHGGRVMDAWGDDLRDHNAETLLPADVLDAWFDPAPRVLAAVQKRAAWALRSSPPRDSRALERHVARRRHLPSEAVLAGAGSTQLIHDGLRALVKPQDRVLILDPTYSEYPYVLSSIGCTVIPFRLHDEQDFRPDPDALVRAARDVDWVVLVEPNNPTGQSLGRDALRRLIAETPSTVRYWVDETYLDFVNPDATLESAAAADSRIVVCKSLSKAYALSGVRVAYLVSEPTVLAGLRRDRPWAVSTMAHLAAAEALDATAYYEEKWYETRALATDFRAGLLRLGLHVGPVCANFLLCRMPGGDDAQSIVGYLAENGILVRGTSGMGTLGPAWFRVAVRSAQENDRILRAVGAFLSGDRRG